MGCDPPANTHESPRRTPPRRGARREEGRRPRAAAAEGCRARALRAPTRPAPRASAAGTPSRRGRRDEPHREGAWRARRQEQERCPQLCWKTRPERVFAPSPLYGALRRAARTMHALSGHTSPKARCRGLPKAAGARSRRRGGQKHLFSRLGPFLFLKRERCGAVSPPVAQNARCGCKRRPLARAGAPSPPGEPGRFPQNADLPARCRAARGEAAPSWRAGGRPTRLGA